jgi:dienelactone hydrolase
MHKTTWLLIAVISAFIHAGCAVPQPRGVGQYARIREPSTGAWYHLYLPANYVKNQSGGADLQSQKWPLVMTLHGMKPYDNARPQEREWEQQADLYGYIVCAPELESCDSFMEFPLTMEHDYVLTDKRNIIAIMDHIFATTAADPEKVLLTSWSSGGYLAHYFANRFPGRFACMATRLSNFSAKLMVEDTVPLYRDRMPVAVFIGDGDFPACRRESQEATAWYQAREFRVVRASTVDNMGHRRIPQTSAAFFADQLGIQPAHPAEAAQTLASMLMTDYNPPRDLIARFSPGIRVALPSPQDQARVVPTVLSQ